MVLDAKLFGAGFGDCVVKMIPKSPGIEGLSPPPYCRCHKFIFYPYITEPAFCRVTPTLPSLTSSAEYDQRLENTYVASSDSNFKREFYTFIL